MARGSKPSGTKSNTLPASLVRERAHAPTPAQRIAQALERKPSAVTIPSTSTSVLREQALKSMQKTPAPAPSRPPVFAKFNAPKAPAAKADVRRQYPRADIAVRARLSLADDPSHVFEATLPTVNLSVGGMFLESSFFLKLGTRLHIHLSLPQGGRDVHVKGEVVRVETSEGRQPGFALRFSEYFDGSQVILATHFLSPVLKEFLVQYAKEHRFEASSQYLAHTADVLAAWELKKAELGGDVWDLFSSKP